MRRQKNWNILRKLEFKNLRFKNLKKLTNLLLLFPFSFLLFTLTSCDRQERIINSWHLQTVLKNNELYNDSSQFNLIPKYTYYDFYYANTLTVRTFVNGQFTSSYNGLYKFTSNSTIEMTFTIFYQRYEITAKIKKLTRNELNIEYEEDGNTYFLKLFAR